MKEKKDKKDLRCGMVSIVGRPNVGKSTLLNKIVGEKITIVSSVPQTTRNQVRGIYSDERGQIVFIDTPGLHLNKDKLDQFMNQSAFGTTKDADCIIHLVDVKDRPGVEEGEIVNRLAKLKVPIILGINKVDLADKYISEYIALWERVSGKAVTEMTQFTLMPLSGKTGIHIEELLDEIFEYLPKGPALYPTDVVTDVPQRMVIADIIREKFFNIMRHEVPHSLAVVVEDIRPRRKKTLHMLVTILVERESQREIVIGKKGENLKKVGTLARIELEDLLESKVFIELFVKNRKNWRDDNSLLLEMGYHSM